MGDRRMQTELTREDVKALFDFGVNTLGGGNLPYAAQLLEMVAQSRQVFYTAFALSSLAQIYRTLRIEDLELGTIKRIIGLPEEQRMLLDPKWIAACYQKTGDLKKARSELTTLLKLSPEDPGVLGNLAEVSLLDGSLEEAEKLAERLAQRGEPGYQILGRLIKAFSFALRNKPEESAAQLNWLGQFFVSVGSIPTESWDYRDIQALLGKLGPNARAATLLINVLTGSVTPKEFAHAWTEAKTPVVA
jgi:tetratricopeptide (TPR) repeat protein